MRFTSKGRRTMDTSSFSGSRNTTTSPRSSPVQSGQRCTSTRSPGFKVANMLVLSTITQRTTKACRKSSSTKARTKAFNHSFCSSREDQDRMDETSVRSAVLPCSSSMGQRSAGAYFTTVNRRFQRIPVYGSLVNQTSTALPTTWSCGTNPQKRESCERWRLSPINQK